MAYRIKELNGKKLESAIKHGVSASDLCREYGCTTAQLERQISQIYNGKATRLQGIWRALRDNDRARFAKATNEIGEVEITINEEESTESENRAARMTETVLEQQVRLLSQEGENLMQEIGRLDEEITKAEKQYQDCEPHVFDAMDKVELAKKKVAIAEEELKQKQQKYNELYGIAEEKFEALGDLQAKRLTMQSEVDKVREKIWELTQVTLGVDIEAEEIMVIDSPNGLSESQLEFSGAEEIFNILVLESECEHLTVRTLKLLALTIAGARNLNMKVKLVCDDDKFAGAFAKFV